VPSAAPAAILYESAPTLWAPDGHAFASLVLGAPLPGATPSGLRQLDADQAGSGQCRYWTGRTCAQSVALPYPDAALRVVATRVRTGTTVHPNPIDPTQAYNEYPEASFAWRPGGQQLAAILPGDGFGHTTVRVTLLSTASGSVAGTLSANAPVNDIGGETEGVPPIAWSPSGQQLAIMDYGSGLVTIWGAQALPR
jgi:hypothetical protein